MNKHWRKIVAGMCFLALMAFSNTAKADGFNFTLKVEDDDEAHFQFKAKDRGDRERSNPMIWRAARDLREAKRKLWIAGGPDFGGHRVKAIRAINEALAALWRADRYDVRHPDVRGKGKDRHHDRREDRRERPQF